MYPTNILAHSTAVKSELGDGGGHKVISTSTLDVQQLRRFWAYPASTGLALNSVTGTVWTVKMVIDKPLQDIVMRTGYDVASIDDMTLYVDMSDNFKWKYKKVLRMDGVKTIRYVTTTPKEHSAVVFDFEKSKLTFTNRERVLLILTKIYYLTTGGDLRSTETNARYNNKKSDLQQLADTNLTCRMPRVLWTRTGYF